MQAERGLEDKAVLDSHRRSPRGGPPSRRLLLGPQVVCLPLALAGEGRSTPWSKCGSGQAEHHLLPGHTMADLVPSPSFPLPFAERGSSQAHSSVQSSPPHPLLVSLLVPRYPGRMRREPASAGKAPSQAGAGNSVFSRMPAGPEIGSELALAYLAPLSDCSGNITRRCT